MPNFSRHEVILVRYPFTDLSGGKVRPAVIISPAHPSADLIVVPLTSRIAGLLAGEFPLGDWRAAGLNVPTAVKRGLYTVHDSLIVKSVGNLALADRARLEASVRQWIGLF